jgi:hypothetical protein
MQKQLSSLEGQLEQVMEQKEGLDHLLARTRPRQAVDAPMACSRLAGF